MPILLCAYYVVHLNLEAKACGWIRRVLAVDDKLMWEYAIKTCVCSSFNLLLLAEKFVKDIVESGKSF